MLALGLGGCSTNCISSDQKLARLAPGMSYDDVSAIMGCQGRLVRGSLEPGNAYAMTEWPGPRSRLFHQTDMLFLDGRLFWYDSQPAPGF
jgi:hypothetical protein